MESLHAVWHHSRLYVWRELVDAPCATNNHAQGRAIPHPAAASADALRAIIGEVSGDGLLASSAEEAKLAFWLPCREGRIILSQLSEHHGGEPATLERVAVPTLAFRPADAIDLLLSRPMQGAQTFSVSMRFWAGLARLVTALLARQQFIPTIEERETGRHVAEWRPYIADRDELAWLEKYAAAMPPLCRAVASNVETDATPATLVDRFIVETADAVIRRDLATDEFFQSVHERARKEPHWELRWLSGLLGDNRRLRGDAEENAEIASSVRAWIGQLEEASFEANPALTFTLLEPDDDVPPEDSGWHVRFNLHSAKDGESLDIGSFWSDPPASASVLGHHLVNRREHLLAELNRAGQSFPELRRVAAADAPRGINLTTQQAHAFLREWAPLLVAQGFGVELPEWAKQRDHRLGIQLFIEPNERQGLNGAEISIGSMGLNALLNFDWRVAVGDKRMTLDEFDRMASQGAPLVKFEGRWVDLDREAAARALAFMRSRQPGRMTLAEALRLASGSEDVETGLPIVGLSGTSWIDQLLSESADQRLQSLTQPPGFNGELRPYQVRGLEWLVFLDRLGIGACLADDMGLGKTIQLIALLLHERLNGSDVGPTLLFAPMSVVGNWEREIRRFGPSLRVVVHHGPERLAGDAFQRAARTHDVIITTYGLAQRDLKDLSHVPWHRIALDEAQKIKNPNAHQSLAIRSLRAVHRVALTGTPVENHLSELWSIMEALNPGLLGSANAFRQRFAIPIEKGGDQQRAGQLRRIIQPFVLRRLKSDPLVECDLPEKMEMRVYCNLTPEQAALYEQLVASMLEQIDSASGIRRRGLILATLTKLKQVCNHPEHLLRGAGSLDGRSGKCERIVEMLEEVVEEGDAALVFTQYREMGELLKRLLETRLRLDVPFMHGGTSAKKRQQMIDNFQDSTSRERIFLLSLKAGGFGLNLTRANHVFHFDRWWNPAVEDQATDRVHRIGQLRRVQVHKFVCIGTIEDRIDQLLTEKSALASSIMGSGDEWLTGLSTQELRSYLRLSQEAVAEM